MTRGYTPPPEGSDCISDDHHRRCTTADARRGQGLLPSRGHSREEGSARIVTRRRGPRATVERRHLRTPGTAWLRRPFARLLRSRSSGSGQAGSTEAKTLGMRTGRAGPCSGLLLPHADLLRIEPEHAVDSAAWQTRPVDPRTAATEIPRDVVRIPKMTVLCPHDPTSCVRGNVRIGPSIGKWGRSRRSFPLRASRSLRTSE